MDEQKYVETKSLQSGMRTKKHVVDGEGRTIVPNGTILDDFMIKNLPRLGVTGAYICTDEEDEPENLSFFEDVVSEEVQEIIEKHYIPDEAKVSLSESVKERVCHGIHYMFQNTENPKVQETADDITLELMRAVNECNSVVVDVGLLKVSDEYTFKHSVDVAVIAMVLGKKMELSEKRIYELGLTGLLHDLGKAKIDKSILNKPARLSTDEFNEMKRHPLIAYELLQNSDIHSEEVKMGVLQHHEKMDGSGYPYGLKRKEIGLYARIIAVADIFDALVTERAYKPAYSKRDAVEMLLAMTGELDVSVMRSFMRSVVLYPVDSIVKLSNGEFAKVVANDPHAILRPTVVGTRSGKVYNLSDDINCANIIIM